MHQRHNTMTNAFRNLGLLHGRTLREVLGIYDVLLTGERRDLLTEFKSEITANAIHSAMGQLWHYQEFCDRPDLTDLAIVLPSSPGPVWIARLARRGIATLWFEGLPERGVIHGLDLTQPYAPFHPSGSRPLSRAQDTSPTP